MATTEKQEPDVRTGEVMEVKSNEAIPMQRPVVAQESGPPSPAAMLMWAMENDKGLDLIDKLMDAQDRHDDKIAKQAFHKAMAAFKSDPPVVIKDKKNDQYGGSGYVSRGNLVNTVNASLGVYGLSATFDIDQSVPQMVTVTCILTHELGHSTSVTMSAPPDKSGSKNPIQEIKSTKSYLEVATYESVTGVVASDAGDDDGNAAGGKTVPAISEEQLLELEVLINDNYEPAGAEKLKKWIFSELKISHLNEIQVDRYKWVMDSIAAAIKTRKA